MSRAYRIRVSESLRRVIRARDHVRTELELLPILPADVTADLLAAELVARGFEPRDDGVLAREVDGVTVTVDPQTGAVAALAEAADRVELESDREGRALDDWGQSGIDAARERLRDELRKDLETQADDEQVRLQQEVTNRLEGVLQDLRGELDQAVNRVTAEALKQKAAQLGRIKELTEDQENGSMTIVLEV